MALNYAPFTLHGRRVLLLAEGEFSPLGSKTAVCYLRYRGDDVVAVLDSTRCGQTTGQAAGVGGDTPIVASFDEALGFAPEVAIVGVAPRGGQLDDDLRRTIEACFAAGLDVVSGLHSLISDEPELAAAASGSGARYWDVRYVPSAGTVASGEGCSTGAKSILVVGTDCNVGKMTATVELYDEALRRGVKAAWAATGQTGIMLRGRGICIDRVIGDFIGGAAEELVNAEGQGNDVVFVEGQGALLHPGYAGVTLGLLFGVMPDCMILAHDPGRDRIRRYHVRMPTIPELVARHEAAIAPLKTVPVVALALNTADYPPDQAERFISDLTRQTGLPVTDPVRYGASEILDAVLKFVR